ncbi:MAG: leucyl/phenylalanyl-tRNA--protein transferase [Deltaproteobacteria bacterium]|nr:leucyl/phenylalanyl-tRNA--protein transferase [Deltaproteobacteria bacterium]
MPVFRLTDKIEFPDPILAEAGGLLAVGGDLSQERLLLAYKTGIFPWFSDDEPILWWSPDPRLVLFPKDLRISGSLKKIIRKSVFRITMDTAFQQVISGCAAPRDSQQPGTWINPRMIRAYTRLHRAGFAHSVEAWLEDELVGGLYGLSLGNSFFGESMFSSVPNASKVAFVALVTELGQKGFGMIDCQVTTDHLLRFGAKEVARADFFNHLKHSMEQPTRRGIWRFDRSR